MSVLLTCNIIFLSAQSSAPPRLNIGDEAPSLNVKWVKGEPVNQFEKGTIYVLEFWATWCKPCIEAMPHLSDLATKYRDNVKIIGVDVFEKSYATPEQVKQFLDTMGNRMNYYVVEDNDDFMVDNWLIAASEQTSGIPKTFVVDQKGKLAWIGHPIHLDSVLLSVVSGSWEADKFRVQRNRDKYLETIEFSIKNDLKRLEGSEPLLDYLGQPDSVLYLIDSVVKIDPDLRLRPFIAGHIFSALLKTNTEQMVEFGNELIRTDNEDLHYVITYYTQRLTGKIKVPKEAYFLAAKGYQKMIDLKRWPEHQAIPDLYAKMANCFWRAKDKVNAVEVQKKAIALISQNPGMSQTELSEFKSTLRRYEKM
ncbi:TlpA family protein disulfide reductase [Niabella sp. 22666]|uniref:TlpA family protein disulfide reductase n=1 Tax=Niabella sp. 22666 TaxID=3453954 RepID=UPI003F85F8D6